MLVVVIGASGFLGQHVLELLHSRWTAEDDVIRAFDLKPFRKRLDYDERLRMEIIVGSVCSFIDVRTAVQGADVVFHLASVISYGTSPDYEAMRGVNIEGTKNVINACKEAGVKKLIYTSSINVVLHDGGDIVDGDESLPTPPSSFIFPGYGHTKSEAERLVLNANDKSLRTLSLRLTPMYGEGDYQVIPQAIKPVLGYVVQPSVPEESKCQYTYVGNAAWAHLVAHQSLDKDGEKAAGEAYFVLDDTPLSNTNRFFQHFIREMSLRICPFQIPMGILYVFTLFLQLITLCFSPFVRINLTPSPNMLKAISRVLTFTDRKAQKVLGYKPLYTFEESLRRSGKYYADSIR